jgi:hypothetical protein
MFPLSSGWSLIPTLLSFFALIAKLLFIRYGSDQIFHLFTWLEYMLPLADLSIHYTLFFDALRDLEFILGAR